MKAGITVVMILSAVSMDLSSYRIKNELIFAGLMTGITVWMPSASVETGVRLLCSIAFPVLICWLPFRMHALGAGDIKLFSVIGCLNCSRTTVCCIGLSFLFAAGISLGKLLSHRQLFASLSHCFQYFQKTISERRIVPYPGKEDPDHRFHFSPAILLGYLTFLGVEICRNTR